MENVSTFKKANFGQRTTSFFDVDSSLDPEEEHFSKVSLVAKRVSSCFDHMFVLYAHTIHG